MSDVKKNTELENQNLESVIENDTQKNDTTKVSGINLDGDTNEIIEENITVKNDDEKENQRPANFKDLYLSMFGEVTDTIEVFNVIQKMSYNLIKLLGEQNNELLPKITVNIAETINVISKNEIKHLKTAQIVAEEVYMNLFPEQD